MKKKLEKKEIDLIPTDWTWECPHCLGDNDQNGKTKTVTCGNCHRMFKVEKTKVHVAIGRGMVWKIFSKKRSATSWVNRMRKENPDIPKDNYCTEFFYLI